jgi:hypothetical protein
MKLEERWLAVPGFPQYDVSDQGRIRRRLRNVINLGRVKVRKLKQHKAGYPMVDLYEGGRARWCLVHRLVLEAFVGPCPPGHEACHNNGDPSDNRLSNLRWDTKKANQHDRRRHGTHLEGEAHPMNKLSAEQVLDIRRASQAGASSSALAEGYGVHAAHIRSIVRGRSWKRLPLFPRETLEAM